MFIVVGKKDVTRIEFRKLTGTNKILKQIALDEDKYVYQLVDEVFREKFPDYFRKTGKNAI